MNTELTLLTIPARVDWELRRYMDECSVRHCGICLAYALDIQRRENENNELPTGTRDLTLAAIEQFTAKIAAREILLQATRSANRDFPELRSLIEGYDYSVVTLLIRDLRQIASPTRGSVIGTLPPTPQSRGRDSVQSGPRSDDRRTDYPKRLP
jgi:hypothetical protein